VELVSFLYLSACQGSEYYFNLFNWLMDDPMFVFSERFISQSEADGGIKMKSLFHFWFVNSANYDSHLQKLL